MLLVIIAFLFLNPNITKRLHYYLAKSQRMSQNNKKSTRIRKPPSHLKDNIYQPKDYDARINNQIQIHSAKKPKDTEIREVAVLLVKFINEANKRAQNNPRSIAQNTENQFNPTIFLDPSFSLQQGLNSQFKDQIAQAPMMNLQEKHEVVSKLQSSVKPKKKKKKPSSLQRKKIQTIMEQENEDESFEPKFRYSPINFQKPQIMQRTRKVNPRLLSNDQYFFSPEQQQSSPRIQILTQKRKKTSIVYKNESSPQYKPKKEIKSSKIEPKPKRQKVQRKQREQRAQGEQRVYKAQREQKVQIVQKAQIEKSEQIDEEEQRVQRYQWREFNTSYHVFEANSNHYSISYFSYLSQMDETDSFSYDPTLTARMLRKQRQMELQKENLNKGYKIKLQLSESQRKNAINQKPLFEPQQQQQHVVKQQQSD